jgi:hypothetical protein
MRERERERERERAGGTKGSWSPLKKRSRKKMKGGARKGVGGKGPRKWSVDVSILSFVKERL